MAVPHLNSADLLTITSTNAPAGRAFTQADNTPDRNLLIIDQALAAKEFQMSQLYVLWTFGRLDGAAASEIHGNARARFSGCSGCGGCKIDFVIIRRRLDE
jgi:hypothetical protein